MDTLILSATPALKAGLSPSPFTHLCPTLLVLSSEGLAGSHQWISDSSHEDNKYNLGSNYGRWGIIWANLG